MYVYRQIAGRRKCRDGEVIFAAVMAYLFTKCIYPTKVQPIPYRCMTFSV